MIRKARSREIQMKFNRRSSRYKTTLLRRTLALLTSLVMLGSGMVRAQSPGTFTATGSMRIPRYWHSATLLHDGRVLIAGGENFSNSDFRGLASAEVYDPATGTFTATGSMTTPRTGHTATLLPDGRVLMVGGAFSPPRQGTPVMRPDGSYVTPTISDPLPLAELYDPATGTFRATGDTITPHPWLAATLLPNGMVFISGSLVSRVFEVVTLAGAELYDPASGTFAATGNQAMAQIAPSATLLPNGKVLVVDGGGNISGPNAQIYDSLFSISLLILIIISCPSFL